MNKERMLALAAHIEALPPEKFEMQEYFSRKNKDSDYYDVERTVRPDFLTQCGTAACIAGHAVFLFAEEADWVALALRNKSAHTEATRILDLTTDDASTLFYGFWGDDRLKRDQRFSTANAAKVLREMVEKAA